MEETRAETARDVTSVPGLLHAVVVGATIASGTVRSVHTAEAEAAPGVVAVYSRWNAPPLEGPNIRRHGGRPPLQDGRVSYPGEPVAVVVALDAEQARGAATLVRARYDDACPALDDVVSSGSLVPGPSARWGPGGTCVGDVEAGLAAGTVHIARTYATAARHHVPTEPPATLAIWSDGDLELVDAPQGVVPAGAVVAGALGMPEHRIRVRSDHAGGGSGSAGDGRPDQIIAAMIARELQSSVRLVSGRAGTSTSHGFRTASRQHLELAAGADGRLTALRHHATNHVSIRGEHVETPTDGTRVAYACPAIETTHRLLPNPTITPSSMPAPHEGTEMFAVESAMDELAHQLGMDPLALRLRNYCDDDPTTGRPFSGKNLNLCYWEGARRIGWNRRPAAVRSMRENGLRVGWGMATAVMPTRHSPSWDRAPDDARHAVHSFGAVFAKVRVDDRTGRITVPHLVGVYSAGRIVDPVTARKRVVGGLVRGLGQALPERSVTGPADGRFVGEHPDGDPTPVGADVGELDVDFVEEHDEHAATVGARGIGEIGAVGVCAAIANAVFHATGIRIRELPLTVEDVLDGRRAGSESRGE